MNNVNEHNFYMINMWLDTRQLMQLGRMLHLPLKNTGTNYLVHCALSELFQEQAPGLFCVEDKHHQITDYDSRGRHIRALCYSELEWETLQNLSRGFASPTVYEIVDWDRMASKPMPDTFPKGMKLGYEIRVCPVVRKASDGPKWYEGQELDAFLSRVYEIDDKSVDIDREEIYRNWLKQQFENRGGAKLITAQMKRFSIERMSRRNHSSNRKLKTIQRPDVTLTGKLEVTDATAFEELLRRGIGRHKSFGFGMLKIRRT